MPICADGVRWLKLLDSKWFFLSFGQFPLSLNFKGVPRLLLRTLDFVFGFVSLHKNIAYVEEFARALAAVGIRDLRHMLIKICARIHFCNSFAIVILVTPFKIQHAQLTAVVVVECLFFVDPNVELLMLVEKA